MAPAAEEFAARRGFRLVFAGVAILRDTGIEVVFYACLLYTSDAADE